VCVCRSGHSGKLACRARKILKSCVQLASSISKTNSSVMTAPKI